MSKITCNRCGSTNVIILEGSNTWKCMECLNKWLCKTDKGNTMNHELSSVNRDAMIEKIARQINAMTLEELESSAYYDSQCVILSDLDDVALQSIYDELED